MGSARTLTRRRQRHARRAALAAAEAERLRWERLPRHLKVLEVRAQAPSVRRRLQIQEINEVAARILTPAAVDIFRGADLLRYLRARP